MADIKINLNQGYDDLLLNIVDRITTGVYRAKSFKMQKENSAFYRGLARDRQDLDLLSAIDKNYDRNDPASIRNAKKQSNKIRGSKQIQQIQSFTDQKYDSELIVAEDKVRILENVAAAEKDFAKVSSGKLLPSDSPLLAYIKDFAKEPVVTPYPELNEKIQTTAKAMNQYLQLNEAYFGLDYDKEKGGLQLETFNGIDITPPEFVEAWSLIQQSHDLYELKDYEGAFEKLTKTAEVVADVHQKQDKPRTVKVIREELEARREEKVKFGSVVEPTKTEIKTLFGKPTGEYEYTNTEGDPISKDAYNILLEKSKLSETLRESYATDIERLEIELKTILGEPLEEIKPKIEGF